MEHGEQVTKIRHLLRAKDDTQRFVGLALLKSVLDNSPPLRRDEQAVQLLWESLSSRFLDRLLSTGSNPANANAKQMLDLAVSVLHTFAALLPSPSRAEPKFTGRVPGLVDAVLHRWVGEPRPAAPSARPDSASPAPTKRRASSCSSSTPWQARPREPASSSASKT